MKTTSVSGLRRNLSATINEVASDHEPVLITRSGGKASAVLVALDDFASCEETSYLLRSPRNAARLRASIAELNEEASYGKVPKGSVCRHSDSRSKYPRLGACSMHGEERPC